MMRFEGKVALVAGGRSGIGRAIARRLRDEGATVVAAQPAGEDAEFRGIAADLADPEAPERVAAEVIARAGRLDVLVNNAGLMLEAAVEEMSPEDRQRSLAVNLTAPFLLIRAALPHLRGTPGEHRQHRLDRGAGRQPSRCMIRTRSAATKESGVHPLSDRLTTHLATY